MADKAQLKCNQGDIYPLCSLDNMVRSVSSSEAVSIPVLDSDGKIPTSYFPDDIGGGGGADTEITSLGSAGAVVIEAGSAYSWDVMSAQTMSFGDASSGQVASSVVGAYFMEDAAKVTVTGGTLNGTFAPFMRNDIEVEYRDGSIVVTPVWSGCDYVVTDNSNNDTKGTLKYGLEYNCKIISLASGLSGVSATATNNTLFRIDSSISIQHSNIQNCKYITGTNVTLSIFSSSIVKNAIITSKSHANVLSSGILSSAVLLNSGACYVATGGTVKDVHISRYSYVSCFSRGAVSKAIISSGGKVALCTYAPHQSASAYPSSVSTTILRGGTQWVCENGYALSTTISSGGLLLLSRSAATGTFIGLLRAVSSVVLNGGTCAVYASGIVSNTMISKGGRTVIYNKGSANTITVSSGGILIVSSGGVALSLKKITGATVTSVTGATITYA